MHFWAFWCTVHTQAHTRGRCSSGATLEKMGTGQACSEKNGKEDKLEAMQGGEEKAMQGGRKRGEEFSTQPHSENTAARSEPHLNAVLEPFCIYDTALLCL